MKVDFTKLHAFLIKTNVMIAKLSSFSQWQLVCLCFVFTIHKNTIGP